MSESEDDILVGEEATPHSLLREGTSDQPKVHDHQTSTNNHRDSQSFHSAKMDNSLSRARTANARPNNAQDSAAAARTGSVSHSGATNPQGTTHTLPSGDDDIARARRNPLLREGGASLNPNRANSGTPGASNRATSTTSTSSVASREGFSTSTPIGQHYPNGGRSLGYAAPDREYFGGGEEEEEEEEEDWEELREEGGMGNVAGSILGYSQLMYENNREEGEEGELEELYVPIAGYEVMEQRAKFTVFKLQVQKREGEGYFIFRRYTDFTRLNNKLKILYPCFRLALPPKRWFGNNYDPMFLEDRMLGLQAFLNNVTGHKDIKKSAPVKDFLCLSDPPGPHDSLEESRVMVESLEEVAYSLRRDMADRDRQLRRKDEEIARLKARIQELENAQLPIEPERVGTDQESESSTVEGDRRSCIEADQVDHGIADTNDEGISETMEGSLKVSIETLGKEPIKCGKVIDGKGDVVTMAIGQAVPPAGGDSR